MTTRSGVSKAADRLIEAAVTMLEEGGDEAVQVHDVAEAAGVPYPVLESHFAGREELVEAAYVELYRRDLLDVLPTFVEEVATARGPADFENLIRSVGPAYFHSERAPARRQRAQVLGAAMTRPALASAIGEIHREFFDAFADATRLAHKRGWIRPDLDLRAVAAVYLGIVNARVIIESGGTGLDPAAWDHAAISALRGLTPLTG